MQDGNEPAHHNGTTMDGWQRHSTPLGRAEVSKNMMPQYRQQSGQNSGRPGRDKEMVLRG